MESTRYGYQANFKEEVSPLLQCCCCHYVLRDPRISLKCGHRYCLRCLQKLESDAIAFGTPLVCPVEKLEMDLSKIRVDNIVEEAVKELEVFCDYMSSGCTWEGRLGELEPHAKDCSLQENVEDMSVMLSRKVDLMERNMQEKNIEILTLKKEIKVLSENDLILRKELRALFEELKILRTGFRETNCQLCDKNNNKITVLEDSFKDFSQRNITKSGYDPDDVKLKNVEDIEKVVEKLVNEKTYEIRRDVAVMVAGLTTLETKVEKNCDGLTTMETKFEKKCDDVTALETKVEKNCNALKSLEKVSNEVVQDSYEGFCDVKTLTETKTVVVVKFYYMKHLHETRKRVYGQKFYSRSNGYRFRLAMEWSLNEGNIRLGIQACKGMYDEMITQPFSMPFQLTYTINAGREWNDLFMQKDYGRFLTKPGEDEDELNIFWVPTYFSYPGWVYDDTFTVWVTMETP